MTLQNDVEQVGKMLLKKKLHLVTAESCTGGGLSYWITTVPGSSQWFDCGFVTYSNEAKINMLDVNASTIQRYGAVSQETAIEMAKGALSKSRADISVAITGIAGPQGGSLEKPVGTVWFSIAMKDWLDAEKQVFTGDRETIRLAAIEYALKKMMQFIEKKG